MAEGIVQQREATVGVLTRCCLEDGARSERSRNGRLEVSDDEVQMERRPMSCVGPALLSPFEGLGTPRFEQQVDGCFCPYQFDESAIEAPADAEPDRPRVEGDGAFHVVNVQID